ncbi:transporter associated domain-containing protein [Bradyrhizobium sp. 170]|uniref:transporter associated domain-containing protein n=1 Tax=Bradyrhizobium sp. 170 TaxID=2782641 RepID=UPI003211F1F5
MLVFLLQEFGTIPTIGDRIDVKGWRFEIVGLDGRRIDKVLVNWLGASINA